ncbi:MULTISPECIES: metal-dependent transcriptional regulator [Thiomicrorhabdus]|uniref:Transcriptional regulator MntR n=1 Tax=Thiomicrorhabdus heinhorstiae TaxID=2748010 RepID=A0ABS0BW27_9GAMM|nr:MULTISPECIES: metal-dependent transcriptional regulator [Thiomicrorhabdus]MBF6058023.1 metal-dependent transcriptional regulator [Thiomicrorhabdus heinhorstiae]
MASKALEDYLKIIYKLESGSSEGKGVQTSAIAERLAISQASVSNMLKKLAEQHYIEYARYHGVSLTPAGRKIALGMVRKHRILELYLVERLGYSWDEVDEEAEVLEHSISDKLANRMWEDLGRPTQDPHGSPIPDVDGAMQFQDWIALTEVDLDQSVRLRRIKNRTPEELRYLSSIGLSTGTRIVVKNRAPAEGPLLIKVEQDQLQAIDYRMAEALMVSKEQDA